MKMNHRIIVAAIWIFGISIIVLMFTWLYHLVAPIQLHYISHDKLDATRDVLLVVAIVIILNGRANRS